MNSRQRKIILTLPLIIYSGIIFTLSSFPQPDFIDLGFQFWDKILHLKAFFIYGLLTITAIQSIKPELSKSRMALLTLVIGFLFGLSDEFHQYFVPGRESDIWDLAADVTGVCISLPIINFIRNFTAKIGTK